jgi:heme/copper-type cytochrome/quinol oxidase subunit 2
VFFCFFYFCNYIILFVFFLFCLFVCLFLCVCVFYFVVDSGAKNGSHGFDSHIAKQKKEKRKREEVRFQEIK